MNKQIRYKDYNKTFLVLSTLVQSKANLVIKHADQVFNCLDSKS